MSLKVVAYSTSSTLQVLLCFFGGGPRSRAIKRLQPLCCLTVAFRDSLCLLPTSAFLRVEELPGLQCATIEWSFSSGFHVGGKVLLAFCRRPKERRPFRRHCHQRQLFWCLGITSSSECFPSLHTVRTRFWWGKCPFVIFLSPARWKGLFACNNKKNVYKHVEIIRMESSRYKAQVSHNLLCAQ